MVTMPDPQHSLRKLPGDFVISPGTQVVVQVAKALPGGDEYKPAGSVGVVVEAPPSNREPYRVRFANMPPCGLCRENLLPALEGVPKVLATVRVVDRWLIFLLLVQPHNAPVELFQFRSMLLLQFLRVEQNLELV